MGTLPQVSWSREPGQPGRWARWAWGLLCLPGAQWRLPPHPLTCPIVPFPGWGPAPPQGLPAPSTVAKARLKGSIHQGVRLANPRVLPSPRLAHSRLHCHQELTLCCPLPPREQARASGDRSQGLPSKSREHPRDCGAGRGARRQRWAPGTVKGPGDSEHRPAYSAPSSEWPTSPSPEEPGLWWQSESLGDSLPQGPSEAGSWAGLRNGSHISAEGKAPRGEQYLWSHPGISRVERRTPPWAGHTLTGPPSHA